MFESFISSFGSKLLMTLLISSTVLTTGVAISKVSGNLASGNIPVKGINIEAAENIETEVEPTKGVIARAIAPIVASVTRIPTVAKAFLPAVVPSTIPTTGNTNSNACIITLSGQQYDVTNLRSTHSGGDVFKCGTDITTAYNNKHGTNLSRMQKYLVTGNNNTTNSITPTGSQTTVTPTTIQHDEEDDDREDNEHKDRYIKNEHHDDEDENDD